MKRKRTKTDAKKVASTQKVTGAKERRNVGAKKAETNIPQNISLFARVKSKDGETALKPVRLIMPSKGQNDALKSQIALRDAALKVERSKVIALEADGSGMYTVQALWTMVREQLDITVVLLNNRSYAILNIELSRVGVEQPGPTALSLLDLSNPDLEWADIARGMGMLAVKVETVAALDQAVADAMAQKGPCLIEVML